MAFRVIGFLLAVIFAALCGLHLFWAAGGRWGLGGAIPREAATPAGQPGPRLFTPGPAATLAVAFGLAIAAAVVLGRSGWLSLPFSPAWLRLGALALGALFLVRAVGESRYLGLFKSVRDTEFARYDTFLFVPLCLLLGGGALWLGAVRP